jgi:hypothetical protein
MKKIISLLVVFVVAVSPAFANGGKDTSQQDSADPLWDGKNLKGT